MNPPTVYALTPNWKENILEGDRFELDRSTIMSFQEGYNRQVQSTDVIFLENQQGKLVRRTLPLVIENREFPLKLTRGVERASFPKGHLYSYLIFESEVEP
ncbi:hypothetical protein [Baaleninema sp.]|uniref:hypothetical protein n=1 Tax=Baaleninema sp. TaxID=3101197 RepID=UPI003D07225C